MKTRACPECGKVIRSLSGLLRHHIKCPVLLGKERRVVKGNSRHGTDCKTSSKVLLHAYQLANRDSIVTDESTLYLDKGPDDGIWIDIIDEAMDNKPSPLSTHYAQSRLSTAASIRTESYEEITGRRVGRTFDSLEHSCDEKEGRPWKRPSCDLTYYLFQSPTDFAAA